jgi:hypothetical protein
MGLPPPAALGHTPTSTTTAQQTELDKWKAKVRQAIALSKRQHHRRAVKQLLSTGVAEPTAANIAKLDALNTTDSSTIPPCPADAPLLTIIDPDVLITLIRKRRTGGAGGCSGWTPEILAVLVEDHICFQGILMLIQDIANGDIDHHSRDLLCASLLHGISKPDSKDLRPLALGEEFLKLANLYCYKLKEQQYADFHEPLQFAMKTRGGCERAIQTTQAALEVNEDHIAIHLDIINAYGTSDRGQMLEAVYSQPHLLHTWRLYDFSYGRPSQLLLRHRGKIVHSFISENGVKQGDVLATLGFCTLIQPALETANSLHPEVSLCAIADDIVLAGPRALVFEVYDSLIEQLAPLGLTANLRKSVVQVPNSECDEELLQEANQRSLPIVNGNRKYVGSMLGFDTAQFRSFMMEKINNFKRIQRAICDPDLSATFAMYYARVCVWYKPVYLLRTLPSSVTVDLVDNLKTDILGTLLQRLDLPNPLPDMAQFCFSQPVKHSGLGFRDMSTLTLAARWASLALCAPHVDEHKLDLSSPLLQERRQIYDILVQRGVPRTDLSDQGALPTDASWELLPATVGFTGEHYQNDVGIPISHLQRLLTHSMEAMQRNAFLGSGVCSIKDLVRIRACKQKSASLWISNPNTLMTDRQICLAVRLRAGLPPVDNIESLPTYCACKEKFLIASDPYHAFSCSRLKRLSINTRHDRCQNLLASFARQNSCIVHLTPKQHRSVVPDGEVAFCYSSDYFDVSGINPIAPSYVDSSINDEGKARQSREAYKITKYREYSSQNGKGFVPFVLESFGGLGARAHKFLTKIVEEGDQTAAPGSSNPFRMSLHKFLVDLSATWQSDNANIIMEWLRILRLPNS